jgi:hypothetical protein
MKRIITQILTFTLLAGAVVLAPSRVQAQDTSTNSAPATPAPKKHPHFHGKVNAIDLTAKTITVGKTTYQVTSDTKIFKEGKPATLEDGAVGDGARGLYKHDGDQKVLVRLYFGPPPPADGSMPPASGGTPPPQGSTP